MCLILGAAPALGAPPDIAVWIEEIDRIAASEPPLLGIDTQIRAARALAPRRPTEAARLLREAYSRLSVLTHQPTRAALLRDWLKAQGPLDPAAAASDYQAYLDSFPMLNPSVEDRDALRALAGATRKEFPELAARAAQLAEAAGRRIREPAKKPEAPRARGLFETGGPPLDGLTPDDIVNLARREKDPATALDLILHAVDSVEDPRRRVAVLSEGLDLTLRAPQLPDRLLAQAMLTRRLYEAGDAPRAAVGGQMLADSFELYCHCESAACDRFEGEDHPGEIIQSFAEYLREHSIPPERLGIRHASLRVRLLILDLTASSGR